MGWRIIDFELCRPALYWEAIRGLIKAKNEKYEFSYNLARMVTTELVNIQLDINDRIKPSQLWPDWTTGTENTSEPVDPAEMAQITRSAIEFLNAI
jgi:hypothetical protein